MKLSIRKENDHYTNLKWIFTIKTIKEKSKFYMQKYTNIIAPNWGICNDEFAIDYAAEKTYIN